jgi:hypothetical protein
LIPNRLFKLLGRICAFHGDSFDNLMEALPHKAAGLSNDDCHPRFIACLLRLGDLLDIDDNRFCPIMQRLIGNDRPTLTKAHEDKHNSIRHLRIDSERIEITAVTESEDGYLEQWRWLEFIQTEIQKQMAQWQDIAPSAKLGLLPTLGKIKVDLNGKNLLLSDGKRSEFSLDAKGAMRLLKGDNIYKREDSMRELLQNAVDATLIRAWLEMKADHDGKDKNYFEKIKNAPNETLREYFNRYPISVSFDRVGESDTDDRVIWKVTIKDQGIGISQNDLKFMLQVGSSSENEKRQAIINDMPEWLRPSGTFGIGLQSVFMWTDSVDIQTQSIQGEPRLHITLHSPTGIKKGLATLEKVEDNNIIKKSGSELCFSLLVSKNKKRFSIPSGSKVEEEYSKHDYFLDKEFYADIVNLVDAANEFSQSALINISVKYNGENQNIDKKFTFSNEMFFSETNSFFDVSLGSNRDRRYRDIICYRGQKVEKEIGFVYHFFNYYLDFYSAKASNWVKINRNELSDEGLSNIESVIGRNLALWIMRNKDTISNNPELIAIVSVLSHIWSHKASSEYWNGIFSQYEYGWLKFEGSFINNAGYHSVKSCMKSGIRLLLDPIGSDAFIDDENIFLFSDIDNSSQEKHIISEHWVNHWLKLFPKNGVKYLTGRVESRNQPSRRGLGKDVEDDNKPNVRLVELIEYQENKPNIVISKEDLLFYIENIIKQYFYSGIFRAFIPLVNELNNITDIEKISLKEDQTIKGKVYHIVPYVLNISVILLPFEFRKNEISLSRFDEFITAVKPLLKNQSLSAIEIRKIYNDLIEFFDNDLMNDSDIWKKYRGLASND